MIGELVREQACPGCGALGLLSLERQDEVLIMGDGKLNKEEAKKARKGGK